MKKIFSIVLGLVAGVVLCLLIGYIIKGTSTTAVASSNKMSQFPGNRGGRFGSGRNSIGSGMQESGMNRGSGDFRRGTGTHETGAFMMGSGFRPGTGRRNTDTGSTSGNVLSAQELLNQ